MTNFAENLKAAMLDMIQRAGITDAVKVLDFEQKTKYSGGCETCYFDEVIVEITYLNTNGITETYEYYGDFGALIRSITIIEENA